MSERLPEVTLFLETRAQSPEVWHELAEISPSMVEIAESIGELTGTWNPVEIYTPDPNNLKHEQEKFFEAFDRGEDYNPFFEYPVAHSMNMDQPRAVLLERLGEVRRIKPQNEKDRLFRVALYTKIRDDLATCDLVDGIKTGDEALIGKSIRHKYGESDPILVEYAEKIYRDMIVDAEVPEADSREVLLTSKQQKTLKDAKISAGEMKEDFEWALNQYGILRTETNPTGYQVHLDDSVTAIDVRDKSDDPMTVYIPKDRVDSAARVCELITHEIEGHARQSMNGMKMFMLGGGRLKMDNEALYEGLGMREEESFKFRFFGDSSGSPAPWYTLAVDLASKSASFSEVFKDIFDRQMRVQLKVAPEQDLKIDFQEHAKQIEKAKKSTWTATYRTSRGHVDTSNPLGFAMTKDLGYLHGWLIDKQLREAGFGGINEMAVIQSGGLQMLARLGVEATEMPYPHKDIVKKYIFEVLLPRLESKQPSDS